MTKYILHGGRSVEDNPKNIKFFSEILSEVSSPATILMIYFAREQDKRQDLFNAHKELFKKSNPNHKISFLYASDDLDEFREQVKQSQIMFVEGGSSLRLLEHLKQLPDIKELIQSMDVYVGSSAGASILSKYAFPSTADEVQERLGILPIKIINHYDESKKDRLEELKNIHPEFETYALSECEYIVMEQ